MEQNTVLDIKGMTCASCVFRIEKILQKDDGVITASVNLATERASISYEPSKIDVPKIISLISTAGYEAKPSETNKHDSNEKLNILKREKKS
jgi:Cu+-exporting ATPase